MDCMVSVGLVLGQLKGISWTGNGVVVGYRINWSGAGAVKDCIISAGLVLVQK